MSFEISIITDEISADAAEAARFCQEHGIGWVELRRACGKRPHELLPGDWRELRSVFSGNRVRVCCVASAFAKTPLTEKSEIGPQLDLLRRTADTARELECPLLRGFSFLRAGEGPVNRDLIRRAFERVPEILEEWEVTLGIENEPGSHAETGAELREFLDTLALPRLAAVWDPGNHWAAAGGVPPAAEGMTELLPDVVHVHMKDMCLNLEGEPEACFPGQGAVDWRAVFSGLASGGYGGCVSLETQVPLEGLSPELRERFGVPLRVERPRVLATTIALALFREMMDSQ